MKDGDRNGDGDFQRRAWNEAAPIYRARHQQNWSFSTVHYGSLMPDEDSLKLLGDVRGHRVVVVGCGSGENAIALARQGAVVTGVDVSDEQIGVARQQADDQNVHVDFRRAEAHDLTFLADNSQDLALAVYVFPYVAAIEQTLAELYRVLCPGGRLLFSQDHPLRASFWDEAAEEESILPARSYFDQGPFHWPYSESRTPMTSHHRTVGQWVNLLLAAGFSLTRLLEFSLPPEMFDQPWTDEYTQEIGSQLPQTILFVAKK